MRLQTDPTGLRDFLVVVNRKIFTSLFSDRKHPHIITIILKITIIVYIKGGKYRCTPSTRLEQNSERA